ncbi:hypothetical protein [Sandarakinorhabdus rubra]|uniref:hypothetical protein n=1 Tax=Sandarakinorhabdus rubra TaxID=2672568 RepID=UPI0013DD673A|nr:hypothetical protein [Sandarakinorhabdus rubra]
MIDAVAQSLGQLLASDAALMLMSMSFGVLLGMLWSGRSFPRRLPRALVRSERVARREA